MQSVVLALRHSAWQRFGRSCSCSWLFYFVFMFSFVSSECQLYQHSHLNFDRRIMVYHLIVSSIEIRRLPIYDSECILMTHHSDSSCWIPRPNNSSVISPHIWLGNGKNINLSTPRDVSFSSWLSYAPRRMLSQTLARLLTPVKEFVCLKVCICEQFTTRGSI